jgi:hypothetical protein
VRHGKIPRAAAAVGTAWGRQLLSRRLLVFRSQSHRPFLFPAKSRKEGAPKSRAAEYPRTQGGTVSTEKACLAGERRKLEGIRMKCHKNECGRPGVGISVAGVIGVIQPLLASAETANRCRKLTNTIAGARKRVGETTAQTSSRGVPAKSKGRWARRCRGRAQC